MANKEATPPYKRLQRPEQPLASQWALQVDQEEPASENSALDEKFPTRNDVAGHLLYSCIDVAGHLFLVSLWGMGSSKSVQNTRCVHSAACASLSLPSPL
eukprot:5593836-Prymnesium_polylepis.1